MTKCIEDCNSRINGMKKEKKINELHNKTKELEKKTLEHHQMVISNEAELESLQDMVKELES